MSKMTSAQIDYVRLRGVCRDVAADMASDAKEFDGKPFNGRTVAEYFGNQGAAIAALAEAVQALVIDANRLCDRNLGGTYEDDCRRSIDRVRALFQPPEQET